MSLFSFMNLSVKNVSDVQLDSIRKVFPQTFSSKSRQYKNSTNLESSWFPNSLFTVTSGLLSVVKTSIKNIELVQQFSVEISDFYCVVQNSGSLKLPESVQVFHSSP